MGMPTIFGKWLTAIQCLFMAPQIMREAHAKANGEAFAVPNLSGYQVCVSEPAQMTELGKASVDHLSFNEIINETLSPKSTMRGLHFSSSDPYNKGTVRPLKSGLRSGLPRIQLSLDKRLEMAFEDMAYGGRDNDGWTKVTAVSISQMMAKMHCSVILGEDLTTNPVIAKAALQYSRDAFMTASILRVIKTEYLQRIIGSAVMRWSGACDTLDKALVAVAEERMNGNRRLSSTEQRPVDAVQWVIDSSSGYSQPATTEVSRRVLGFLLGASAQLPMLVTYALYNLCKHPEYLQPLRAEVNAMSRKDLYDTATESLPLLDSFLRETGRFFPLSALSAKRKVLRDFTFSNGAHVPAGNYVGISQQAVMLGSENYESPSTFNGFRFAASNGGKFASTSRLSHPSNVFPIWGSVSRPCPARFYVSMIAKMIMAHLLAHYDVMLADKDAVPSFSWGFYIIPRPNLTFLMRERTAGF